MNRCTSALPLRRLLWVAVLCLSTGLGLPALADESAGQPQMDLARTRLSAGMHQIEVQVAQTPEQRSIGLMHRREMPQHEGMLFVFERPGVQCFWMKNTLLPLTAAFVADDGRIVNLADMQPLSEASHCSDKPVRYVLEMNQGWFAKKRIEAGYQLRGALFAPR
jgi:uncharacterized membrane protein (UPF0127 family)